MKPRRKHAQKCPIALGFLLLGGVSLPVGAHDPIFAPGPHVLFKGGVETNAEFQAERAGGKREREAAAKLTYGLTGDWAAGIQLPYVDKHAGGREASGVGDVKLFTKYRFWRRDSLSVQNSAAVLVRLDLDTADDSAIPARGSGGTDAILGLTYGYESTKWYRWASVRYRFNGESDTGLDRGDKLLVDIAGGVRLRPPRYRSPDTVWILELNAEHGQRAERRGVTLADSGGTELFLSPGIFWTRRNFAIKAGVQIPVFSNLNGDQDESDYRARLIFELHL